MNGRFRFLSTLLLALLMATVGTTLAFGQGGSTTSSLSGTVADSSGGVIPGATVTAKNNATATEFQAATDEKGSFTIPALDPGTYTVTVALMGFKTWSSPDVKLAAAAPAKINVALQVGQLEETVVVHGAAEIVQTQTAAVTTTLSTTQINSAPLPTRNTLDFVAMLPGVNTTGNIRDSTVMGLSASATNITIDGINTQDNFLKSSDGFFSRISPRMDAVEEVSVSTANPGAESAGQGAVQIRFQTRQGTNKFQGSAYWYNRNTAYNTNYWFNVRDGLPKEKQNLNTAGFRLGGPVVIPKLFDGHDKLFFFFNYEEFRPGISTTSRSRTVLTDASEAGNYLLGQTGTSAVNIWDVVNSINAKMAGTKDANGVAWVPLPTTTDPTVMKILTDIKATYPQGTITTGGTRAYASTFNWMAPSESYRRYPTTRFDVNVSPRNRVGMSFYWQRYFTSPDTLNTYDPSYPGFPGGAGQISNRWSWMTNWRSTITSNMVNEVRAGMTGGPILFNDGINSAAFANQDGYAINLAGLMTSPYRSTNSNERNAPTRVVEDTLSWIKGKHAISLGASFTQILLDWPNHYAAAPLTFGITTGDPVDSVFSNSASNKVNNVALGATLSTAADSTDVANMKALYALLTGRVSSVAYTAYLGADGKYKVFGDALQQAHENEFGSYIQDSWKIKSNLTLNYGVRWEIQFPFVSDNLYYSQLQDPSMIYGISGQPTGSTLFTPGVQSGVTPQLVPLGVGVAGFKTDWNNVAPSLGFAWKPQVSNGLLKKILSSDPVIRGGYSLSFLREGMQAVSGIYSYNPGGSLTESRNVSLGTWVTPGSVLFRDKSTVPGPTAFSETPVYPLTAKYTDSINAFDPNTQVPYTHSWNVGFQRTLDKNTAVEIRYVGNRARNGWFIGGRNLDGEANILAQSSALGGPFIDEFKRAQQNLLANIAAGRGTNFKYYGAGTGTVPLPVLMAYMQGSGLTTGAANLPASYTSNLWQSSTFYGTLGLQNPSATGLASALQGNATTRQNALNAGLPSNYFYVAPDMAGGGAWITGRAEDNRFSNYDAVQIEVRRRLAGGLLVQGSYQNVLSSQSSNAYTLFQPAEYVTNGVPTHTLKVNWVYELPFGQGKKWGSGVSRGLNHLVGGWSFDGNGRLQSGNRLDFGNVKLVNMTDQQLQDMFFLRYVTDSQGKTRVYMLPQDVIANTILAQNTSSTSLTGYAGAAPDPNAQYIARQAGANCIPTYAGDPCGGVRHHYVFGPQFVRFDMALSKRINMTSRVFMEFRAEALNVFNNINYFGTANFGTSGTALSNYEVTSAYRDSSNTQDPGGRLMQFSWRISW
jgi:hypothetical protein